MLPAKQNKIDLSKLSEEELKSFRLYGKLPTNKNVMMPKVKERKYFDSGDYAMQKAGKNSAPIGVEHPSPETIPHSSPTNAAINTLTGTPPNRENILSKGEEDKSNIEAKKE
ncbi:Endosulfine-domain-containing protein [Neoconidiobolus thromboides FSU 785]|nr:Endosulfine-domain-containing protein [Neoconidiobolus thromboides FSU 785]